MAQIVTIPSRKSQPDRNPISKQIDDWVRVSDDYRNRCLGENWFTEMEGFYNLTDKGGALPSFRPQILTPELQTLMMREANDLSDTSPRPYIIDGQKASRDQIREKALQAEWRRAKVNYHAMFTTLSSMFNGMTPMQVGFDPEARNGQGAIWTKMRDPRTFKCDPFTSYELDWSYVILEDRMHLDRIKACWPKTGRLVRPGNSGRSVGSLLKDQGYGFQMPSGPMSSVGGISAKSGSQDDRPLVRWCFCEDFTREKIEAKQIPDAPDIIEADFQWKYPNGRLIVECEGVILQDGDNPYPLKRFPIIPFWSTLPLYGIWATPAVKFTQSLQQSGERLYTQLFENAVRLNNGVWILDESSGIDPDSFGGIPGEVQTINANSKPPVCIFPPPMPQQMTQLPQVLFDKQKEIQGFSDARSGNPGAGNISSDLFDQSVMRSQGVTQLRGRLNAESYQRLAEMIFYTMARYYKRQNLPFRGEKGMEVVQWQDVKRPDQYDVMLDEASIRPLSQAMLQKLVPQLWAAGKLGTKRGLDMLDWPDAEGTTTEVQQEMALAALAKPAGNKK